MLYLSFCFARLMKEREKIMNKKANEKENSIYHDTWMLLKKYRDVVWSLEL